MVQGYFSNSAFSSSQITRVKVGPYIYNLVMLLSEPRVMLLKWICNPVKIPVLRFDLYGL